MIATLKNLYESFFRGLQCVTENWLLGLSARLIFSSVLFFYFMNSVMTKVGSGFPGWLIPQNGAYAQILPTVAEQYNYNASEIPFLPYGLIVYAGTYAEFILPILILLGLFTRLASAGFIGFIAVMSIVDVAFHGAGAKTIGVVFDRVQDSAILDQRLLWLFPLIYLLLRGPGFISLDAILGHFFRSEHS